MPELPPMTTTCEFFRDMGVLSLERVPVFLRSDADVQDLFHPQ
jgi:hypothetical protein